MSAPRSTKRMRQKRPSDRGGSTMPVVTVVAWSCARLPPFRSWTQQSQRALSGRPRRDIAHVTSHT
eukprot:2213339-Rhodomonas_salina.1